MKKLKLPRTEWLKLSNPAFISLSSTEEIRRLLIVVIAYESSANLRSRLVKIFRSAKIRSTLNGFAKRIEKFGLFPILGAEDLTVENAWALLLAQFEFEKAELQAFIVLRERFEGAFTSGNFDAALGALISIEEQCGESLWLVKSKILLFSHYEKREELLEYCNSIKDRSKETFTNYLLGAFQIIVDSGNAEFHHNTMIAPHVREFSEADRKDLVGLLQAFCTPIPLLSSDSPAPTLTSLQRVGTIDAYIVSLELLAHSITELGQSSKSHRPITPSVILQLSQIVDDPVIDRISLAMNGTMVFDVGDCGKHLLSQYEQGYYQEVVDYYLASLQSLPNPFAYANLVAKALAYLPERDFEFPDPIRNLIHHLSKIYKLDAASVPAHHELISEAIRFRTLLTGGYHVQLAIFKAIPYRYPLGDAKAIATMAWIAHPEVTPLAAAISLGKGAFNWEVVDSAAQVPPYRAEKRKICRLIIEGENSNLIFSALKKLPALGILKKDYLELFSAYAVYVDAAAELLVEAANALVDNQNAHICLPMDYLIECIEKNNLCSIEAVLVAQCYVRNISDSASNILNEAFEAFLDQEGVDRPSDLFTRDVSTTPLMIAFFRDVCSLDTLDYLSCFSGTEQLHAERLAILDWLADRDVVESTSRMRELEELVSRLIQDSAASDLTGPRIFVDDALVRRNCLNEVNVLLQLLRAYPNIPEREQVITYGESSDEGVLSPSYATGERNTVLFRIWLCVRTAFLFDERHGLAKNLITEIKHGFFANLMRAQLEEKRLLTEASKNGEILPNEYWRKQCGFVGEYILDRIDEALAKFSRSIKSVIDKAEDVIKITSQQKVTGVFVQLTEVEFKYFHELAERADTSADLMIEEMLKLIWSKVEISLSGIRDYLNIEFRKHIDDQFETLELDITEQKGSAALHNLMSTIRACRRDVREDVTTISEWFRRANGPSHIKVPLDDAIRIAIGSFERLKLLPRPLDLLIDGPLYDIPTSEHRRKALTISLTNLLDNCFRHSGLGRATAVVVRAVAAKDFVTIEVRNDVSQDRLAVLDQDYLSTINKKFRGKGGAKVLTKQGGTGIGKAYYELSEKAPGSDLSVRLEKSQFIVEVRYVA
ncbi:hypothetical protein [Acidovorax sp. LjRoot117]|uniref:hypothetical protein n=1 Tax=Acidovorax sp. LjRoot117 TaxID=3342255 RepID=UPI003ECDD8C0